MIEGSDSTPEDPLAELREQVNAKCRDMNVANEALGKMAATTAYRDGVQFGHLAEFWLLLSVLEVVAHPLEISGHAAGSFRDKAKDCDDVSSDLFRQYGQLVVELLHVRADSSDQRKHIAAIYAKRPYVVLADTLVHTR